MSGFGLTHVLKRVALAGALLVPCMLMPVRADEPIPPRPPLRPAVFNWNSTYGGVLVAVSQLRLNVENLSTSPDDLSGKGQLSGLTVGRNFQLTNWVIGTEADITFGESGVFGDSDVEAKFIATSRLRIGYRLGHLMPYFTAGVLFAGLDVQSAIMRQDNDLTSGGLVMGTGAEFVLTRSVSGKVEYLYGHLFGDGLGSLSHLELLRAGIIVHLNR